MVQHGLYDLDSMPTTVFAFKLEHVIGAIKIDTGQSLTLQGQRSDCNLPVTIVP